MTKISEMSRAERLEELQGIAEAVKTGAARMADLLRADWPGASTRFLRGQEGVDFCDAFVQALNRETGPAHDAVTRLAALAAEEDRAAEVDPAEDDEPEKDPTDE